MARRLKVALFADGGFLAHTTRALEIGRALHRAYDHEIVFCCTGPYAHLMSDAGFQVFPIFNVDREVTLSWRRRPAWSACAGGAAWRSSRCSRTSMC